MSTAELDLELEQEQISLVQDSLTSDRRLDVDAKQARMARLLEQVGCDGLLLMNPANFSWLTSGGQARGVIDPDAAPVLYFSRESRWLFCSNVDTQRLFDEELDGLGFQVKEWPWHWGRQALLDDVCHNRKVACDEPLPGCVHVKDQLLALRRRLTPYEQACFRATGQIVGQSLEATARTLAQGATEREIAGQLGHRLMLRGVQVISLSVVGEGRSVIYRQAGYTPTKVQSYCVLTAVTQKYGLHVTASRAVSFGEPGEAIRRDHNAACRVSAGYLALSWPQANVREILSSGRRIYLISGAEHEWKRAPQGHLTGRVPVECALNPDTDCLLESGNAIVWNASAGTARICDTFLVTEDGPHTITQVDVDWPVKRIHVQGADLVRPDILIR